jgi:uncharacterized protein (TIGR02453 family)
MATAATSTERFTGFPDGGIDFLLELQAEQSRPWFKAHQADFDRLWKRPLEQFVTDLQVRLSDAYPHLAEVEPHFMRIQRDTRFARDKTPYKTWVAASIASRPGTSDEEHATPGLYVSFGLEGDYVGVGAWHLSPAVLNRYRAAVDHPRHGPAIQKFVDALTAQGYSIESMETLKRTPAPYAADHPRAELLKRKGLAVGVAVPDGVPQSPELLDFAERHLRLAQPLVAWLDKHLA